ALGSILGAFVALMKLSKIKIISWIASIYIEILRGTPMLVQVFIAFAALVIYLSINPLSLTSLIVLLICDNNFGESFGTAITVS
ncbi:ABC transporter permease subunit, partial [Staphylococcus sp. EG-SA-21]|uniref:ABC transporter permease subunit n=1 Tax=Staphylococcus sp. EG-SA-21 TaxID=2767496 RepID=UPI001F11D80D